MNKAEEVPVSRFLEALAKIEENMPHCQTPSLQHWSTTTVYKARLGTLIEEVGDKVISHSPQLQES